MTAIRRHVGQAVVYTLTVARDHTFFVGQARVLVHNCNVPNYYDLGWDPTRKEFIESEARGGARLQQHLGLRLMRYTKNADFDFVDSNGTLYDLVGPLPRSAIGKASAQQFIASIRDHLYKISTGGKVVIDLEGFTHEAQDKILQYLTDLPPSLTDNIILL